MRIVVERVGLGKSKGSRRWSRNGARETRANAGQGTGKSLATRRHKGHKNEGRRREVVSGSTLGHGSACVRGRRTVFPFLRFFVANRGSAVLASSAFICDICGKESGSGRPPRTPEQGKGSSTDDADLRRWKTSRRHPRREVPKLGSRARFRPVDHDQLSLQSASHLRSSVSSAD